ncbi:hypothetical protein [Pasteurella testudinis]|uniref:hypothetical protein n=1 Tax=Pasteurella testudinis TaxID=761 RepID=UPI0040598FAF
MGKLAHHACRQRAPYQRAIGLTGNWEYLNAEQIYLNAKSQDKDIVFVEGASHVVTPIDTKYGDTVKLTYDYMADWLGKAGRFR